MSIAQKMGLVLFLLPVIGTICPRPLVVISLSPPPVWAWQQTPHDQGHPALEKMNRLLQKPNDTLARKLTEHAATLWKAPNISGILGLYNGYLDFSSSEGILNFPIYGHREKELYIFITPEIAHKISTANTIENMLHVPAVHEKSARYHCKKYKTEEGGRFWRIAKADLPDEPYISLDTVVIVGKARNFYVQEGDFISPKSPHIVLPEVVHVVGNSSDTKAILKALNIARFFEDMRYASEMPNEFILQRLPQNE